MVTRHRLDGPDAELVGRIIEATPDYAVAECRTPAGPIRVTMSDDTASIVFFRKLTQRDWQSRRRR
jgi:hypothetical protein